MKTALRFKNSENDSGHTKSLLLGTLALLSLLLCSCASKMLIQSEPPQAEVSVKVEGRSDKVKLGQTPLEISETQLAEKLNLTADSTQWIQMVLEKKDYATREVLLPSNRWGERSKTVKLLLTPSAEKSTIVEEVLAHFFNAKKFVDTKQFEQAHGEIDRVLAIDSKSAKALNMKAGIYFVEGKLDEAKKLYREALKVDPNSSDAIKMLEKIQNLNGAGQ